MTTDRTARGAWRHSMIVRLCGLGAIVSLGACAQIFGIDPPKRDETTGGAGGGEGGSSTSSGGMGGSGLAGGGGASEGGSGGVGNGGGGAGGAGGTGGSCTPITEVCNGVDDDCDGMTDEGNPGGGVTCATGLKGECANGTKSCMGGALACIAPDATDDICDGKDNDCDGMPDNQGLGVGEPCMTDLMGECKPGLTACESGILNCKQSKMSETEVCDNKDNDCDGMADEDNPGGGATCTVVGLKGACAVGTMVCQGGTLTCTQVTQAATETCDDIDNDCDGDIDETIQCGTCVSSATIATSSCVSMALPATVTLTETCKQVFPPPSSIPVAINEPGTKYYVSPTGNDGNDGTTPSKAWATLCHALAAVVSGNTILVAQGAYVSSSVVVAKGVTVKGGYNAAFSQWNPDMYPSIFYGRLTLNHASAVWGGFRMIGNPIAIPGFQHYLDSGTFVRNYVEASYASSVTAQSGALYAAGCVGAPLTLIANDVYAGGNNATPLSAIGTGYQRSTLTLDSNRVCAQGKNGGSTYAFNGSGPNTADAATVLLRNNVLEAATNSGYVVYMAGQSTTAELYTVLTNNTLLAAAGGIAGTAATNGGKMRWSLTNNILFNLANVGSAVSLGTGMGVSFDAAEYNLIFGFATNTLMQPPPSLNVSNDTSNMMVTASSVFVDATLGDFRIKVGGQADELGKNVYGLMTYGSVVTDIVQAPRPTVGAWDRGAFKN